MNAPPNNLTPGQTQLLVTFGPIIGLVAGYFAAWWGIDSAQAAGILTALIAGIFSLLNLWATRRSAVVSQVANMPEVREVKLDKTEPGTAALSASTPDNVTSS